MPDIDKNFVKKKLELLDKYYEELKKFIEVNDSIILSDQKTRYAIERVFMILVEEMIDINNHFIRSLNLRPVDDLKSTFTVLGENNILPYDFAYKISPITGVRNILVHQYEKLDFELFLKNLRKNISDFAEYIKYINQYTNK